METRSLPPVDRLEQPTEGRKIMKKWIAGGCALVAPAGGA